MSTASTLPTFNQAEPIPGYRIQERIGAGGYGEVYRAEAPGGIAKAVKVVFGMHDDERARRELHALNRIKEVRHPFLLSLERIELVDGHLVIVAELATGSLKDLFDEHREAGRAGIPRDELLTHMRDAADALDFICQKHSLQHLDIKPENLLLVGGRVKVADFGLVKDLQDVNCSMMSGLTPVYAPPELFDGRPNTHSDQYSLAIVYEEMLTGVLPFSGRTTAQLATQHLHSKPRLDRLPPSDQAVIARALSKNPQHRFRSCREMVDNLQTAGAAQSGRSSVIARDESDSGSSESVKTEVLSHEDLRAVSESIAAPSELLEPAPQIRDLPPLEIEVEDNTYRPTVFIGIGGLAAKTLQALQRRLTDRFGDLRNVPSLQSILFETDPESLKEATDGEGSTALNNDAAVLLPLRQAAEYRRAPSQNLQWLSRRWMFNIPRSLQTQGFRPLGRLALVDHSERAADRIRKAIKVATDQESLTLSARTTGLAFRQAAPRVFIVTSTTGGAGSGMVLDVAYLTRHALRQMGLSDDLVCGVLAHCTSHQFQAQDISVANTYSLLTELSHYSDGLHGYPADVANNLPEFGPQDAPFSHTYVIDLGEDLTPRDFQAGAESLAAYLYCNSVTTGGTFFDQSRVGSKSGEVAYCSNPRVRTFGLCQLGFSHADVPQSAVDGLCEALVKRWRAADIIEPESKPTSLSDTSTLLERPSAPRWPAEELRRDVARQAEVVGLPDVEQMIDHLHATAEQELGSSPEAYLVKILDELVTKCGFGRGLWSRRPATDLIVNTLNSLIRADDGAGATRVCLESALDKHVIETSAQQATALRDWLMGLVLSPRYRVLGAQRAADLVAEHLRNLNQRAGELLQSLRQESSALEQTLRGDREESSRWIKFRGLGFQRRLAVDSRLFLFFLAKVKALIVTAVQRMIALVLAQVTALDDTLRNLAADLNRLAEVFKHTPSNGRRVNPAPDESEKLQELVIETIGKHKELFVAQIDRLLEHELLRIVTAAERGSQTKLPQVFRRAAHTTILDVVNHVAIRKIHAASASPDALAAFSLRSALKSAAPLLSKCGGARRLVLIAPHDLPSAELTRQLGDDLPAAPTVVTDAGHNVIVCYEAEQLSLQHVAAALLDRRSQYREVASRLHTRVDVQWSPL